MNQQENILNSPQKYTLQLETIDNIRQYQQVPRLFHFLKLNRDWMGFQSEKQLMFDNKNLTQIVRQLAKYLNKEQLQYNKIYVGNLCNFILIVKRPRYSIFLTLLNQTFYFNLTCIFKDVVLFWKQNQHNDQNQIGYAKLIALLKIMTQIHMNKKNYPKKVFGQGTLDVLTMIDPTTDEKVLRFFIKIIFQCQVFINNKQKVQFVKMIYRCLKHPYFPITELNKTIRFVQKELPYHYLQSYEQNNEIVNNCKNILILDISKEDSTIDFKLLANFINCIRVKQKQLNWTLTQFSIIFRKVKNIQLKQNKISCMNEIVKNLHIEQKQEKINVVMSFIPQNHNIQNYPIKILPEIFKKLSSGCLIQIVTSQFFQTIINIIKVNTNSKIQRFIAVQIYKIISIRMKLINQIIYDHMTQILAYLKEEFAESETKQVEQAFNLYEFQLTFFERFTLD